MHRYPIKPRLGLLGLAAASLTAGDAAAYRFEDGDRWSRTATDGTGLAQGDPTTLTWSLVPDGTLIFDPDFGSSPSNLVAFFDELYPGGSGDDLTQRPWFYLFDEAFERFEQLSGLRMTYDDDDDGVQPSSLFARRGILDVRGDIRLAAFSIDGQSGQNTLAQAYRPDRGDVEIDSDNALFFGNDADQARGPRNVLMHEIGHALGIALGGHVASSDAAFLMEPFISTAFDGPQLDDILALHRGYGDRYERFNTGAGNETFALATPLGLLLGQSPIALGTDAGDTVVDRSDTDFVSIDDDSDIDFFSFSIDAAALLDIVLTPMGPTYNSGVEGGPQAPLDTASLSDLTLSLFATDGTTLLAESGSAPAGSVESIDDWLLDTPGTYYARVTGATNAPQLYQLEIQAEYLTPLVGDLDADFEVDADDLAIVLGRWGDAVPPGSLADGDASGDGQVGIDDLDLVLASWTGGGAAVVPEPACAAMLLLVFSSGRHRRRV